MSFTFLKNKIENSYMSHNDMIFSTTGDGRLDSAESEASVIKHLEELFNKTGIEVCKPPQERWWYDVLIRYNNQIFPINIKMTSGNSYDNVSSKLGMLYALTGIWPEEITGLARWAKFNTILTKNINPSLETDYYFIIYFKNEEKFLFTSLKHIHILVANGNNLPFQCKWSDNYEFTNRSKEEQVYYLMNVYFNSWLKKTGGFEPLMEWKEKQK